MTRSESPNEVEELAAALYRLAYPNESWTDERRALQSVYRAHAQTLINAGWRKQP